MVESHKRHMTSAWNFEAAIVLRGLFYAETALIASRKFERNRIDEEGGVVGWDPP